MRAVCRLIAAAAFAMPVTNGLARAVEVDSPELNESSGLTWSGRVAGRCWTHNDSGDVARLFAIDASSGRVTGGCRMLIPRPIDWEAITRFVDRNGTSWLLIADCGDNEARRDTIELLLVPEPDPDAMTVVPAADVRSVLVRFEHGPMDCEAVAIDPTGTLVVMVGKSFLPLVSVDTLSLEELRAAASPKTSGVAAAANPNQAMPIATPTLRTRSITRLPLPLITDMAVDPAGGDIYLASYFTLFRFPPPPTDETAAERATTNNVTTTTSGRADRATVDAAIGRLVLQFKQTVQTLATPPLRQIEAIAVDDRSVVWVTSEGNPCVLRPIEQPSGR